ncbi:hypothetical protein HYDPIDRAFT_109600 [Hydnomerulius pinastri MD-312]|nr:hypothetical protein HYDPIDRAFT_109600 [Hydnomerulius pinastri MD-312]
MTHPLAPTTVLPALAHLQTHSAARVQEALRALRDVYFVDTARPALGGLSSANAVPALKKTLSNAVPRTRPKRTGRLIHHDDVPDSGYASAEEEDGDDDIEYEEIIDEDGNIEGEEDEALDILRSDELEKGFAIKWLTGLVKRSDSWISGVDCSEEEETRMAVIEDASRLLARFAGDDEPEEALTRTFAFPFYTQSPVDTSKSGTAPITFELNDAPVDGTDHTAVGLQSWGSAIIFAERMCANPERYLGALHRELGKLRVIELGAGTGLLSIAASQIFSRFSIQSEITATDYHPSVLENLLKNIRTNRVPVIVEALDWSAPPSVEPYDVVLAADVIYHPEHARWIRDCVERTLTKSGVFWLIIPLRSIGRHEGLGNTVEEAFPNRSEVKARGERLAVVHREEVGKRDGIGRVDEGGYTLLEIRWV